MLGIRKMNLGALGKQPRNTKAYAKSIDEAANTPFGKYTREQYRAWVNDLKQVQKQTDTAFTEVTKGSKTPDEAAKSLSENPMVIGDVKKAPFTASRKTKQKKGGLVELAKNPRR